MQHPMTRRLVAAVVASLQVIPAGLLPQLAHAQTVPAVQPAQYEYDAQGNLTKVTDPNGKITTQQPDALDRTQQITQPEPVAGRGNPVIKLTYDGLNRLIMVRDPKQGSNPVIYSGLQDNISFNTGGGMLQERYDASGALVYRTNSRSQSATILQDALNRPTLIYYTDENAREGLHK